MRLPVRSGDILSAEVAKEINIFDIFLGFSSADLYSLSSWEMKEKHEAFQYKRRASGLCGVNGSTSVIKINLKK